jgi:hypothetical protein
MMELENLTLRLQGVEDRLARLEALLVNLSQKLDASSPSPLPDPDAATTTMQAWVTDYVSMRLQQLVPHTCEHAPESGDQDGPYLDGTDIPCTEEVVHRVGRIPIPFVREMVVQRVAQKARDERIARVDVAYFEQAATF